MSQNKDELTYQNSHLMGVINPEEILNNMKEKMNNFNNSCSNLSNSKKIPDIVFLFLLLVD